MSALVLLNLLNELGKSDRLNVRLVKHLLLLHKFDKFINTGARIVDSIYHAT